jgi:hypothetical protein
MTRRRLGDGRGVTFPPWPLSGRPGNRKVSEMPRHKAVLHPKSQQAFLLTNEYEQERTDRQRRNKAFTEWDESNRQEFESAAASLKSLWDLNEVVRQRKGSDSKPYLAWIPPIIAYGQFIQRHHLLDRLEVERYHGADSFGVGLLLAAAEGADEVQLANTLKEKYQSGFLAKEFTWQHVFNSISGLVGDHRQRLRHEQFPDLFPEPPINSRPKLAPSQAVRSQQNAHRAKRKKRMSQDEVSAAATKIIAEKGHEAFIWTEDKWAKEIGCHKNTWLNNEIRNNEVKSEKYRRLANTEHFDLRRRARRRPSHIDEKCTD